MYYDDEDNHRSYSQYSIGRFQKPSKGKIKIPYSYRATYSDDY